MNEHLTPKRMVLTEADMAAYRPREVFVEALEARCARLGLKRDEMTVIDWGCGRGELTLWLREQGWCAYGIDIERKFIENGRALARQRGLSADQILLYFDENYRAPFADGSVDFISSDQVLEHVADPNAFARETARVLKMDGEAVHVYPAHRRLIEGHLFMPLVQFTPKSTLRYALIRACVALGIEPDRKVWELETLSAKERATRYYEFSCDDTFYRTPSELEAVFAAAGFQVEFEVKSIHGVQSRRWARALFEYHHTATLMSWALMRMGSINMRCKKGGRQPPELSSLGVSMR